MPWKIKELTGTRLKDLRLRLKTPSFKDNFALLLDKILASDFLVGKKPSQGHSNFKADFDWLIKNDTNYIKILEGKYDQKKPKKVEIR